MTDCAAPRHDGQDEPTYRVLVTGSRDWDNKTLIHSVLSDLLLEHLGGLVIVHGDCPKGADWIASMWALQVQVAEESHPADWNRHGKRAGFIRNAEMVVLGADVCLAFIRNGSRGATHCADLAEKAGIPVRRFTS